MKRMLFFINKIRKMAWTMARSITYALSCTNEACICVTGTYINEPGVFFVKGRLANASLRDKTIVHHFKKIPFLWTNNNLSRPVDSALYLSPPTTHTRTHTNTNRCRLWVPYCSAAFPRAFPVRPQGAAAVGSPAHWISMILFPFAHCHAV